MASTVLTPASSGSTLRASRDLGLDAVGIEFQYRVLAGAQELGHRVLGCGRSRDGVETLRNVTLPLWLLRASELRGRMIEYGKSGTEAGRSIDTVANTGQYL